MTSEFIHLHLHSEYSLVDGLLRVEDLVETAAKQGCFAVALTDHCNLFGMVKFYQAAEAAGIKPIVGAEIWLANEIVPNTPLHRLVLFCQNAEGYRHLTELISQSYQEPRVNEKPVIIRENLKKKNLGLIAMSCAEQGDIAEALLSQNQELAETLVEYWESIFPDRFFIEVTRTGKSEEEIYLKSLIKLAQKKDLALVATNDVRFLKKEDFEAHETRVCIHEGMTLSDGSRKKRYTEAQYLKTPQQMANLFSDLPEALENTVEIAKRCNLKLPLGKVFLPNYPVPAGSSIEDYLKKTAEIGLLNRFQKNDYADIPEVYRQRLETEISVINSMGFAGYFLIVADFIRWANDNKVPVGPGRGSGAGSLVAYALKITGLDPLQYGLLFERFLNPERVSLPDFDIDFCMEGRDRVIEYVANTYGRDSVSQIITFGTMAAKAVIRDVGRVLGHPYGFVDKIAKLIPLELGITLEKALKNEETLKKRYKEEEELRLLIDLARKLEGIARNAGKHAGGVVIAPSKLTDFTPLYCDANEGVLLTQFDKDDIETIGLVKFDFLGLRTLTIIDWALESVNAERAKQNLPAIDIEALPLDDEKTFDFLRNQSTTAIFQLESRGMKDLVRRLQPDVFEEICDLVALFRPGPLQSGMVDDFINRKHGRATPEYLHPNLTSILKPTYGIILYQEQVMQIAQVLAGYTLGAADLLRRAMGKKKPEEMAKQRAIFTDGAMQRGVSRETATTIFDLMEKFAGYGFNKSHSAAYAMLTYQTAWLKAHYPASFMAAVLSSDMAHTDKVAMFVEECRLLKIPLHLPDIRVSQYKFTINAEGHIIYGLGAIKGVGEAAIQNIMEVRQKPFQDLFDFCARVDARKVSKRTLEALIRSGAMDCLGQHRAALMSALPKALLAAEQFAKNQIEGQVDLFGESLNVDDIGLSLQIEEVPEWPKSLVFEGEKETLGFYFSGHPLEQYETELHNLITTKIRDLSENAQGKHQQRHSIAGLIQNIRTLNTKRGDRMAFITLDDRSGRQEIAVFSDLYQSKREILVKDNLVVVEGDISPDEYSGGYKMRCQQIMSLDEARERRAKYLKIALDSQQMSSQFTEHLMATLQNHRGGHLPVRVVYQKAGVSSVLKFGEQWTVLPRQKALEELRALCGEDAIELCY